MALSIKGRTHYEVYTQCMWQLCTTNYVEIIPRAFNSPNRREALSLAIVISYSTSASGIIALCKGTHGMV